MLQQGSKRENKKLFSGDGFSYTDKRQKDNKTWWWCSVRGKNNRCSATVNQVGDTFTACRLPHNHTSTPGQIVSAAISAEIKTKAAMPNNAFTRSSEIIKGVLNAHPNADLPEASRSAPNNLKRQLNRKRQKDRSPEPRDLDFQLAEYYLPNDFQQADIQNDGQRHIILATHIYVQYAKKQQKTTLTPPTPVKHNYQIS